MKERVTLMCGGKKCCPEVVFNDDGSILLVNEDDPNDKREFPLNAEQVDQLRIALNERRK